MTLNYVGNRQHKVRLAEIEYREGEEDKFEIVLHYLWDCGWNVDAGVMWWAGCEVEDRHEFELFKEDFKAAKSLVSGGK